MSENFEKKARKPAKDSKQEKLREHKSAWNDVTSLLIAKLIAFKRGLNGAGDERAEIPPSKITEPLPPELETYLSSIISDYSHTVQGAKFIINEQKNYSQQFGSKKASAELDLTVEASSALSRAWARISLIGDPNKNIKINLLKVLSDLTHDLWNLENELTNRMNKSGPARAVLGLHDLLTHLEIDVSPEIEPFVKKDDKKETEEVEVSTEEGSTDSTDGDKDKGKKDNKQKQLSDEEIISRLKKRKTVYEEDAPTIINFEEKLLESLNVIRDDIPRLFLENQAAQHHYTDAPNLEPKINELATKEVELRTLIKEDPLGEIVNHIEMVKDIRSSYYEIRSQIKKYPVSSTKTSMKQLYDIIQERKEMEKVAHNVLTRWIQRKMLNLFPGRHGTTINRAVKNIRLAVDRVNELMDLLEKKGSSMEAVLKQYRELVKVLDDLVPQIVGLGQLYINEQKLSKDRDLVRISQSNLRKLEQAISNLKNKI